MRAEKMGWRGRAARRERKQKVAVELHEIRVACQTTREGITVETLFKKLLIKSLGDIGVAEGRPSMPFCNWGQKVGQFHRVKPRGCEPQRTPPELWAAVFRLRAISFGRLERTTVSEIFQGPRAYVFVCVCGGGVGYKEITRDKDF